MLKTFSRFRAFSGLIRLQRASGDTQTEPIQIHLKDVSDFAISLLIIRLTVRKSVGRIAGENKKKHTHYISGVFFYLLLLF